MSAATLESVLQHPGVWRGFDRAQAAGDVLPTGFAELDALLPGGGWPRGALTEILLEREGIGELRLLLPALARASRDDGWLAWIAPPHVPYAPALAASGVHLDHLWVARPRDPDDAWWTTEQALRSGACEAVLAWLHAPDERRMRRLQLGAETGRAWGVLFRSAEAAQSHSPAALRLRLRARDGGLAVDVLKRRGGPVSHPLWLDLDRPTRVRRLRSRPALAQAVSPR